MRLLDVAVAGGCDEVVEQKSKLKCQARECSGVLGLRQPTA